MNSEINNLNEELKDRSGKESPKLTTRELSIIYRSVFEVLNDAPFAVIVINWNNNVSYISPKLTEITGYTLQDLPDREAFFSKLFITESDREEAKKLCSSGYNNRSKPRSPKIFRVFDKIRDEKVIRFTSLFTEEKSVFIFLEDITESKNNEEKLIESEAKFRSIVENSHAGIIMVEDDFKFRYVNEQFCKIMGYGSSELTGKDFRNYLAPSALQLVSERYKKRQRGENVPSEYNFQVITKGGKIKTLQISSAVTKDEKGNITTIAQLLDITDKVEAENKLIESENKYRKLFDTASDAIFIMKNYMFIDCNAKTLEMFNCTKEQIIGQPPYKFSPPKQYDKKSSKEKALEKMQAAYSGIPQHFEWIHKKYTGELFDAEVSLNKVEVGGEKLLQAIVRDISERKKIEKFLELRSRIEKVVNKISSTFINIPLEKIDANIVSALEEIARLSGCDEGLIFKFLEDNNKIKQIYRWTKSSVHPSPDEIEVKNLKWWSSRILNCKTVTLRNVKELPAEAEAERKLFANFGLTSIVDIPLVYKEKVIGFLGFKSKGKPLEFQSTEISLFNMLAQVFVNVLQRKKTELDLRESEERLGLALRGAELGLWDWNIKTGEVIYNENWAKILGYKPVEIKPRFETWQKLVHNEDYKEMRTALNDHIKGKTSFYEAEYRMQTRSGKWKWILDRGKVIDRDKTGKALRAAGTTLDITDKKTAEEALMQSEERFRSLFENSAFGIYQVTFDGKFELCNNSFLEIFGYKSFNELKKSENAKNFYASPKDREKFLTELLTKGKISGREVEYKNSEGEMVYVREYARLVTVEGKTLIEGAVEDITEKKQAEKALVQAKEKAEESDKLKSEFLAQMSHEIRTPINTVLSFAGLLKDELSGKVSPDLEESFTVMNRAGKRIIRTIDLLLDMSQLQTGTYEINLKRIDVCNKILKEMADEYKYAAKEKKLKFEIIKKCEDTVVLGDEYTIGQILHNLIDNAIKYTHAGFVKVIIGKEKSSKVYIKVSDTGIGISEKYLPNLFEPFTQEDRGYTRKYEGNGLGLALVKSYCALNNAVISVKSKKGKGTTFKILFETK